MAKAAVLLSTFLLITFFLMGCGTEGTSLPEPALTLQSASMKQLFLAWDSCFGATKYNVKISHDGNRFEAVPGCQGLSQQLATIDLSVHLTDWQNGQLMVEVQSESGNLRIPYAPLQLTQSMSAEATGYLKASNPDMGDHFGQALALSADGKTLAVGAFLEASNATGINSDQADNSLSGAGAVYVFVQADGQWSQQAYLMASNTGAGDGFGSYLALSADGNTLAVSALSEASNASGINGDQSDNSAYRTGAVYLFQRSGATWQQQAYVKASNPAGNDYFGCDVALSADGNTMAVGASGEDSNAPGIGGDEHNDLASGSGAVYIFVRSGTSWSQQVYIKASNVAAYDEFGISVALSADGNTLAVGAHNEDSSATGINGDQSDNSYHQPGAVYVFQRSGTVWSQQAYVKSSNHDNFDYFGAGIDLSADGNIMVLGAPYEASSASGINGDQDDNSATHTGAVYLY